MFQAVPPLPALNVPTNKRQEASVETTTSVQPQEVRDLHSFLIFAYE